MKDLEINISMLFNLVLAGNNVFSCLFLSFLIIDLNFLIIAVVARVFIPTVKLAIPAGITTEEAKGEMEIHPATVEAKISNCLISLKTVQIFLDFLLINSFCFISSLFRLYFLI